VPCGWIYHASVGTLLGFALTIYIPHSCIRFFNPAIVSPEAFGIGTSQAPSPHARRNLVLITKVLQVRWGASVGSAGARGGLASILSLHVVRVFGSLMPSSLPFFTRQPLFPARFAHFKNLANGVLFGQKEAYMERMNPFLESHQAAMTAYLKAVCMDPLARPGQSSLE